MSIQIRGTTETRGCVAEAVRLQVIMLTARLTLRASYLPPFLIACLLSPSLLPQHMVCRGVSTQLPLIKIIGILILHLTLFVLLFSSLLLSCTFFAIPLAKKMHPFFLPVSH
jgi:hypothetical protein